MKKLIATAVALSACSMAYATTDIPKLQYRFSSVWIPQTYDLVAPKRFARTSKSLGAFTVAQWREVSKQVEIYPFLKVTIWMRMWQKTTNIVAKTLFATWDKDAQKRDLKITMVIGAKDREPMVKRCIDEITSHQKTFTIRWCTRMFKTDSTIIKLMASWKQFADKIVGTGNQSIKKAGVDSPMGRQRIWNRDVILF